MSEYAALVERMLDIRPEDHATKSRDYGRGFADAVRRFHELLEPAEMHDGHAYVPVGCEHGGYCAVCGCDETMHGSYPDPVKRPKTSKESA